MGKISNFILKWIPPSCHSYDIFPFGETVRFRKVREVNWKSEKLKWFYKRKHLIWGLYTGSRLHLCFFFYVFCLYYQYHVWFIHCIFMYHNIDMASSILNKIYLPTIHVFRWSLKNQKLIWKFLWCTYNSIREIKRRFFLEPTKKSSQKPAFYFSDWGMIFFITNLFCGSNWNCKVQ